MSASPRTAPGDLPPHDPLEPGDPEELGGYRIHGRLGEGGQGTVYLGGIDVADQELWVAIKWLHARFAREDKARQRFLREADAARSVPAFCTAHVREVGIERDRPYIVSEYVAGPTLAARIADGRISGAALERLAVNTLTALAGIHGTGIIHRDLKPGNIILAADGPRVLDFGIARALDATTTSQVIGTPAYMSPEQFTGKNLTSKVDVFAWGVTMVHAASGRLPFHGDSAPALMRNILDAEPDPAALNMITEPLRRVIEHALTKDPKNRPDARHLLEAFLEGRDIVEPPPQPERGTNIECTLELTAEQLRSGTTKTVPIDGRTLKVRTPAGIKPGIKIRLEGEGRPGRHGGRSGDVILEVTERPPTTKIYDGATRSGPHTPQQLAEKLLDRYGAGRKDTIIDEILAAWPGLTYQEAQSCLDRVITRHKGVPGKVMGFGIVGLIFGGVLTVVFLANAEYGDFFEVAGPASGVFTAGALGVIIGGALTTSGKSKLWVLTRAAFVLAAEAILISLFAAIGDQDLIEVAGPIVGLAGIMTVAVLITTSAIRKKHYKG